MAHGPRQVASEPTRGWMQIVASEPVRAWLQTLTIVAGGLFGIWQFWLKEIVWPGTAPINLTTEVNIKEAGFGGSGSEGKDLEAIELVITARNPSNRKVYLLPNYWVALGVTIKSRPQSEDWLKGAPDLMNKNQFLGGRHYELSKSTMVAMGSAFMDELSNPNKSLSRSFVFYVPRGVYDMLEVDAFLPTVTKEDSAHPDSPAAGILYTLNSDGSGFDLFLYRTRPDGTRVEVTKNAKGDYSDAALGLSAFSSSQQLSLWRSKNELPLPDGRGSAPIGH